MSNEEWWAANRKAAEFWKKVKQNQTGLQRQDNRGSGLGGGAAGVMSPAAGFASTLAGLRDYRDFEH